VNFRIADTFTASLARLTAQEQKAVKTTAFDLQVDPSRPSLSFHRIDGGKDPNFWSVRVNLDLRLIVHKTASAMLLAYVGHHDDAYAWAERRRIETHPTTGAAQLVEVRERVEEVPVFEPAAATAPRLFDGVGEAELLAVGVPEAWLADVLAATEDTLFELAEHLPQEAAEALLDLATGTKPAPAAAIPAGADPFEHPDALRRFRLLDSTEELEQALAYPWEKWTVFLHPSQRQLVERAYGGPARVAGSAGTGKTIVALHRAVHLATRDPAARVLLTTFSKPLANALRTKLERLAGHRAHVMERIEVGALPAVAYERFKQRFGQPQLASSVQLGKLLQEAAAGVDDPRLSLSFLRSEWDDVVDARQLAGWESYRDVPRLGRKTRLGLKQREQAWAVFAAVRASLAERKLLTWPGVCGRLIAQGGPPPFDHVVVDEAQDIGIAELRFVQSLVGDRAEALFFTGDLGQRIFQQPFSWKSLGVDVRGRSHTLKVCYRTSQQIRESLDRLLPASIADVDGNAETRTATISIFAGPKPERHSFDDEVEEIDAVAAWLGQRHAQGIEAHEIGIFVRDIKELKRARKAASEAGIPFVQLDDKIVTEPGKLAIGTMHLAKGLEFRAVAVMACDDEVVPSQLRVDEVSDAADLEEVYNTERHLLYVACTRAREQLWVSGVEPASEFLDDLG
jgi:hypothetical protein